GGVDRRGSATRGAGACEPDRHSGTAVPPRHRRPLLAWRAGRPRALGLVALIAPTHRVPSRDGRQMHVRILKSRTAPGNARSISPPPRAAAALPPRWRALLVTPRRPAAG